MLIYKRYLLNKITSYFLMVVTVLTCLIWFTRAISFIKYITEKGISISSFLHLFILILPWLALLIIPISLFIAIISSYNKMIASNEITILKNSGLDKIKITKPALTIATLLCMFCYIISLYLMPMSNKLLRESRNNFQHNYANIMISPGIFESLNNITIYAKERNGNNLSGILLYDNYSKENSLTLTAESGKLLYNNGEILMLLDKGSLQKFNFKERNSEILNFDNYVVNLSQNKNINNKHKWKASERYIDELTNIDKTKFSKKELARFRVEIHQRFTYPLFSIILALIACSYALRGEFNRKGSPKNNIYSVITACCFIAITMASYDLMEKSAKYNILLYVNLIFFTIWPLYFLKNNFRK
ncbi:LptF/LptG family permease [Rickettsiales bacterium]|nr:LptF/LptG family permease [Rickettsiales bacterium]